MASGCAVGVATAVPGMANGSGRVVYVFRSVVVAVVPRSECDGGGAWLEGHWAWASSRPWSPDGRYLFFKKAGRRTFASSLSSERCERGQTNACGLGLGHRRGSDATFSTGDKLLLVAPAPHGERVYAVATDGTSLRRLVDSPETGDFLRTNSLHRSLSTGEAIMATGHCTARGRPTGIYRGFQQGSLGSVSTLYDYARWV